GKTIDELRKLRILVSDFEVKDIIGRGHFGDVQVVRDKHTETITFFEEERDIMAKATSPWITKLHYAFQDSLALYLIMEFHAGGDLLSLLSRHDDIFEEKMARFYLAEIVLASNDLHKMGYVHRDLKPENVLIDCTGHIKLADFGSAAKLSAAGTVSSKMPVGTPDYVSPELLNAMNSDTVNTYGREVDWWSLGVCMYEMLFGKTPFTDESGSMVATYSNIMNYKACLKYPSSPFISSEAKSLMGGLLQDTNKRLDYAAIRKHPFFKLTNWDRIRTETPPFVPQLQGLDDTSNFEEFEKIKSPPLFDDHKNEKEFSGKDLPFVGFTYVEKLNSNDKSKSSLSAKTDKLDLSVRQSIGGVRQSIGGDVSTSIRELQRLRDKCKLLEESECTLRSSVDHLKFELGDREDMVDKLTRESQTYQMDLETYIAKSNRLSKQIEVMIEERASMEVMLGKIKCMNSEAELIEGDLHKMQMEELEERRKSSDLQRRDLALLESQDERWKGELEDKTHEIHELYKRISELEELIEAYEGQEKEFMEREQALRQKLSSQADSGTDNLELEGIVDKQEHDYEVWLEREHEYKDTIEKLKEELEARSEKARLSSEVRETMATQVHMYKEEVHSQREIIKGLEEQIECYRDDKRHLMSEVSRFREESGDRQFKIAELERIAEERIADVEKEKFKVERQLKDITKQLDELKDKQTDLSDKAMSTTSKVMVENLELKTKMDDVNRNVEKMEKQISKCERHIGELEEDIAAKNKELAHLKTVRTEKQELERKVMDLEFDLKQKEKKVLETSEKEQQVTKLEREKQNFETKIKSMENEIQEIKCKERSVTMRRSKMEDVEDLKQEKRFLESKVSNLQRQVENADQKTLKLEKELGSAKEAAEKEKEKNDSVRSRLQKELHESNLALSEARSLLSATQRQEKATRDTLEGDIRELRQRIFLLEKEKGLNEDNNKKEEAEKAAAQCEALEKRVKEAESRVGASQREKTAGLMERQLLKDSLAQKEHQCQLEAQKADKYKSICTELEAQIRDLEALTGEFEEREAQWKRERTTYEKAVEERENDLEGANQRLNVLKQFRQNSAEMAAGVKDQLEKARLKHQADIDTLKRQMADINKETQRQQLRVSDLESQNSKLHSLVDQQKAVLTASDEENRRLKEEISKVLTENQETKRSNLKLRQNLEEAVDKLELIFGEKIDLENFTEALQGGKFFAKSGGKDAMGTLPVMGDLQTILDNELKKSRQLQEQLDRLRAENYKQANESSKQPGWERRYAKMEGNILLLFYEDNDANPCDTFDLVPPETDVTVHSAVSAAELPSLANSDLPYVFRLEHEPLTTCWPGRVLYLMAPGFPEKQQWVASLEAAIKHLQKGDKVKRSKMEMTTLLDLSGDQRLELNCSLLLSKQLTLLGADEGLFALRLGQSSGEETQPVHHNVVSDVVGCTVFDVGMCGDAVYMVVGMTEKILVMKYNPELRQFCVRKELSSMEPCSCVIVVEGFAIVGTDRFYKINLDHPSLLEFGVYVDNKGRRSRPADMKWSCLPLSLAYKEPFLYVTYFTSVQAITVPASKQEIRGKQTSVDLVGPRYLGVALEPCTVFVGSSNGVTTQMLSLRGKDGTIELPMGKENRLGIRSAKKGDSSKSQTYNVNKYKSPRLCRRLSLTSIDSNSSVSSSSTVSSYSSVQTEL
ncbi:CTRO-like protein, partial [Mya arenaria]